MFARVSGVGSGTCGFCGGLMSSSSVYFTPCWAGKYPDIRVERAGEHMHEFVKALSKVIPLRCSAVRPGRLRCAQPRGKCWIARSWSVMNITTFIPERRAWAAASAPAAPDARPPSERDPTVAADRPRKPRRETPAWVGSGSWSLMPRTYRAGRPARADEGGRAVAARPFPSGGPSCITDKNQALDKHSCR